KYRSIFENAVEGIYQSELDGRFVTVNPTLASMLGFASPEELLADGREKGSIFYADPARRAEFVRQVEAHGSIINFESQIRRADGRLAWISESARLVRDGAGQLIGYEGTMVDISSRKRAEEALARERALLRSLIDSIPDLIFYKDCSGAYLGCNAAFEKYA